MAAIIRLIALAQALHDLANIHPMIVLLRIHVVDLLIYRTLGADVLEIKLPARQHEPGLIKINEAALFHWGEACSLDFVSFPA